MPKLSYNNMKKCQLIFRTANNYEDDEEAPPVPVDDGAGVAHVESFDGEQEAVQVDNGGHGDAVAVATPKPSTSSEIQKVGPSTIHIQKPRAIRMSESAKQRQHVTETFIELLQKEQQRELKDDDEIDATFAACATRMRKNLNDQQREDVIQEINRVVNEAINNVRAGLPAVMTPRNMYTPPMQPAPQMAPPMRPQHQHQQDNPQELNNVQSAGTGMYEYSYANI